jgi:hypothetical protein
MDSRPFATGLAVLGAGLLASSVSAFLAHFGFLGSGTEFARGLFDGVSVVAFAVAIVLLFRGRRTTSG